MSETPKKKRGERGKGKNRAELLHGRLMKHANKLFTRGRPMVDPATGQVAMDAAGRPVMVPPTAADFTAAVKLLTMKPNPRADKPFRAEANLTLEEMAEFRGLTQQGSDGSGDDEP